jgi:hypothetical protein
MQQSTSKAIREATAFRELLAMTGSIVLRNSHSHPGVRILDTDSGTLRMPFLPNALRLLTSDSHSGVSDEEQSSSQSDPVPADIIQQPG